MGKALDKPIHYIFFSNLFLGIISLVLNMETNVKLGRPLNDLDYYLMVGSLTVLFYLMAYKIPVNKKGSSNPRIQFYIDNRKAIKWLKTILWAIFIASSGSILLKIIPQLTLIPFGYWLFIGLSFVLILLYYDWNIGLSLRQTTWLKPFLIGYSWAITTVFLPLFILRLEDRMTEPLDARFYFLFTQTMMYCAVNAILFDLKDYRDDFNKNLQTFVVQYGYHFTLNRIILPLIFLGFFSFITFGYWYELPLHRTLFMLIPVFLLAIFAFKLNRPRPILYYLIAIDGMILLKGIVGILSVVLFE